MELIIPKAPEPRPPMNEAPLGLWSDDELDAEDLINLIPTVDERPPSPINDDRSATAQLADARREVARLQQLHVLASARVCPGPRALFNRKDDGKPDLRHHGFGKAQSEARGQLVYYLQAVDRFKHHQDRGTHLEALKFMNLSKSNGLPGMCAAYLGMRGRLTKKVMGPELVQEAIDSCPVDCIHSVTLEALETLENERRGQTINYKKALVNSGSDQAYRAPPTEAKEMYFGIDESDPEFQEKERRLQERLADEVERQERDAQRGELVDQIFGDDGGAELVGEADPAADMEVAMGIDAYDAGVEAFAEEPTTSLCESDALNTIFSDECAIDDQVSIGICGIGMRREHRANRAHRPIATL